MIWYARSMLSWRKSPERRYHTRQYGAAGPGRRELAGANDSEQEGALFERRDVMGHRTIERQQTASTKIERPSRRS